jgi:hypothetical protein
VRPPILPAGHWAVSFDSFAKFNQSWVWPARQLVCVYVAIQPVAVKEKKELRLLYVG